jgi:hypothetical protein
MCNSIHKQTVLCNLVESFGKEIATDPVDARPLASVTSTRSQAVSESFLAIAIELDDIC